jgi:hypothetical protein
MQDKKMTNLATIGHNLPPTDEEILKEKLQERSEKDLALMGAILAEPVPEKIENDDDAKRAADFISKIKGLEKTFEKVHKDEKAPYLSMGRVVDGFFNSRIKDLEEFRKKYSKPVNDFLTRKAEAEREAIRQREAEARRVADELAAQAAAHEAENIKDTANDLLDLAVQAENKADGLGNYANTTKSASLAKIRTENGTVLSQRTKWVGEPTDPTYSGVDLNALRKWIKPENIQLAINAAVRDGERNIPGVNVYQKAEI